MNHTGIMSPREATRESATAKEVPLREKLKDLGGLLFILAVLFALISLVTFDAADVPGGRYPLNETVHNKGGLAGAHLAGFLYRNFGLASFVLVGFAGFWAFTLFFRWKIRGVYPKLIATAVLIFSLCAVLSLQKLVTPETLGFESTMVSLGGVYGRAFETMLTRHIGTAGALLSMLLMIALSALLATDWYAYRAVAWCASGLWSVARRLLLKPDHKPVPSVLIAKPKVEPLRPAAPGVPPPVPAAAPMPAPAALPAARPASEATVKPPPPSIMAVSSTQVKKPLPYEQPPLDLFETKVERIHEVSTEEIDLRRKIIEAALLEFGVEAKVTRYEIGPTVTTYELELGQGVRVARILALQNDLSIKLMVPNVRVVSQLPGRGTPGIEVPHPFPNSVRLREFLSEQTYGEYRKLPLPMLLGKTTNGDAVVRNLSDMPHLLVAGTTGSGKSICLKSLIASLVIFKSWEELKLLLIDPKMVELKAFEDIPHLWAPVITDSRRAALVLDWLVKEMDDRYTLLSKVKVTRLESYNQLGKDEIKVRLIDLGLPAEEADKAPGYLPYIVVVIDEMADLMMTSGKDVEKSIVRLSQKARAVGIHIIAATQSPRADIITPLIKTNMPSRISFKVSSHVESGIILDRKGAERLLGKGDMLFMMPGMDIPIRAQCTFISDDEIKRLAKWLRLKGEPSYRDELIEIERSDVSEGSADDPLFEEAVEIVLQSGRGSVSFLQRRLGIGYGRAANLIESMERFGIVGPHQGANPREVLMTPEQWKAAREKLKAV